MTPIERVKVASDMFDTARVIVESSLPPQLDAHARRRAVMLRIYGDEIDIAAIDAAAAAADG
ncbi:MAG: hypothetical protein ABI580_08625 [Burkholderiaceae bacterium]